MSKIRRNNFCVNCKHFDQKYEFCDLHKFKVGTYDSRRNRCDSLLVIEISEVIVPPQDFRIALSCDNCMHCNPSRTHSVYTFVCDIHNKVFSEYEKLRNFICDDWED